MGLNGYLNYLDPSNPSKPRQVIQGHNKFITSLAVDKSKNKVYTGAYDAVITAWDVSTGLNKIIAGKGHTNQVNQMQVAGDNLISAAKDDSVRFTSISAQSYGADLIKLDGEATSISTNANGSLVVASSGASVHIIRNQKSVGSVATPFVSKAVSISADEKEVVVGGADNHLYVYSLSGNTLTQTKKVEGHRGPITCVAHSPCGKYFASGDTNREIIVWDDSSKSIKVNGWVFHTARVNCLSWSPDSSHIASGSLDQNIIVWNLNNPTARIVVKNAHHGGVNSISWLDNNIVASAGQDCAWRTHNFKY
jgi:WD40 repeat protein